MRVNSRQFHHATDLFAKFLVALAGAVLQGGGATITNELRRHVRELVEWQRRDEGCAARE